jgi:DNA-binding transcriptional LysR family regulator
MIGGASAICRKTKSTDRCAKPKAWIGSAEAAQLLDRTAQLHSPSMFDWNDLKYFLAIARHHSTIAAGRALRVSQSTVQRRLTELERRIGQQLAKRHPSGYRLTEFGEALLPHAERVAQAITAVEQHLEAARLDVAGVIRLTCPEPLVYRITQTAILDRFHARYPGLRVEFVMSDKYLDLTKGDADVALRSGDTEDNVLVGRKIADSIWAVYASRKYIAKHGRPDRIEALEQHDLVGFDETMANHRAAQWLRQVVPNGRVVARNNSVLGLLYSAKAGLGVAPLPTAIADAEPELVRVLGPIPELTRIWRILTTLELRRTPRVSAFFDFVVEEAAALRSILTG